MNKSDAQKRRVCQICGSDRPSDLRRGILAGPAVAELIQRTTGSWSDNGWICTNDLHRYRHEYVKSLLEAERGELTALDNEVLESLKQQEILSRNPEEELQAGLTVGQRLADRVAAFGGSWRFLILFAVVLVLWIAVNSVVLIVRPFDPYPFIFLNLVLSCLAAVQAPVIMMSQIRQEAREIRHLHQKLDHLLSHQCDRRHAMHDYQVNLKAELERLVEIQEIQMELINETRGHR